MKSGSKENWNSRLSNYLITEYKIAIVFLLHLLAGIVVIMNALGIIYSII